ncbi:MAG: hypothetical protein U0105_18470 [Candidatus Obscuribacterales bacterium]
MTKRILTVHPGIYLSALLSTWIALLVCQSVNREADMRATAQRIQSDDFVVAAPAAPKQVEVAAALPPMLTAPIPAAIGLPRPDPAMFQRPNAASGLANWQINSQISPVQPVVQRPAPAPRKPRIASGLVPPPPPTGLVPPPPPTVPIPTAMLTQSNPYFGQSIAAVAPIPAGPGAAAAANEMFYGSAYTPAPPVMGGSDGLYTAPAGRSGDSYKVVQHRQRKRTIAYR